MGRNYKIVRVALTGATRLNNSVNGNPRFTLHTSDGDYTTSSDASCNYEVTNYLGKMRHGPVHIDLHLTKAGRVAYITD